MSQALAAQWNRAMLVGDLERAWQASDRIRATGTPDPHRFWQGEPFAGKRVMLRSLHGFGDAVQFLRYVSRLRQVVAGLCIEVAPRLVELTRYLDGIDEVVTWGEQAPAQKPTYHVQMEVTELPYIFRTQLADLPIRTRYLRVPASVNPPDRHSFNVGLVWTSGAWNSARSIPLDLLEPLLHTPGCTFWNLQPEPGPTHLPLCEDLTCRQTVVGLAQRIATLDLVITVDTLAAHLAGAIGVPAWVLLQHTPDWRWMLDRADSPWYPSLRLFRQLTPGDWPGVIAQIHLALCNLKPLHLRLGTIQK